MINMNQLATMKSTFDQMKHTDENGKEYWSARELSKAMGYTEYRNFSKAIDRTRDQMINVGRNPENHIVGSNNMVELGSGACRKVNDLQLDRYAAYNVANNADTSKPEVAFAQEYFLQSTDKIEKIAKRIKDKEYIDVRNNLKIVNREVIEEVQNRDVPENKVGIFMDNCDQGYFDMHTREIKNQLNIPDNKPVADMMGSVMVAYKTIAQYNTHQEIIKQDARGINEVSKIGYDENRAIRDMVKDKFGKTPEELITGEDVKKVEARYNRQTKALTQDLEKYC